jgi:hypothetical protein
VQVSLPTSDPLVLGVGGTGPAIIRLPSGARRRARLIAAAVGGFLLPWCVLLAAELPLAAAAIWFAVRLVGGSR